MVLFFFGRFVEDPQTTPSFSKIRSSRLTSEHWTCVVWGSFRICTLASHRFGPYCYRWPISTCETHYVQMTRQVDEVGEAETDVAQDVAFKKWETHTAAMRAKLKASADFNPWSARHDISGLPSRVQQVINVGFIAQDNEALRKAARKRCPVVYKPDTIKNGLYCDLSQAVQRRPWGSMGTLLTGSTIYSYQHDVVIPGLAHPLMHGFPTSVDFSVFGEHRLQVSAARRLTGESFSLPVAAQVIAAALYTPTAPWW
jgi:hypothetical protein